MRSVNYTDMRIKIPFVFIDYWILCIFDIRMMLSLSDLDLIIKNFSITDNIPMNMQIEI